MPQATPALELGARFAWVRCPAGLGLHQGLGRADQVAFFAGGAPALVGRLWGHLVELSTDRETPHRMDRLGQLTDIILGGIATVSQAPDGTPG